MSKKQKQTEEGTGISFDLDTAKNIVKTLIETNRVNHAKGISKKIAVELVGDAGLGKTSAILQIAEELDMEMCKINLAQIEEIGDIVGFPIKKHYIQRKNDAGKMETHSVNESQLPAWFAAGWEPMDRDPVMSYAPPEWISNRKESGILLLDDWTRK
ncbi:hypothetical protein KC622_03190 [Candidatus Dojkabacteria bacterium]|uniref:Uncharacterized protein n=1 Tax=Candidatus Dojkabacteria bacterium TaxID=2099670 RepID=A0A955HZ89_9BACT|nr:hypothetical protein [Candidatus Dojkabacteria bacterium]